MTGAASPAPAACEFALPGGLVLRGGSWGDAPGRVFLLHEPETDLDAWAELPAILARALPVQALALDLPGHGLSDDPWDEARLPEIIEDLAGQQCEESPSIIVAAGATALAALGVAHRLPLAGLVALSPDAPDETLEIPRSPSTAKSLFAGSRSGTDLETARRLAAQCGGWSSVTSIPASARGTALLRTTWGARIGEHIIGFVRDCVFPRTQPARHVRGQ